MQIAIEKPFESRLRGLPEEDQQAALEAVADPHNPRNRLKKIRSDRLRKGSWAIRVLNYKYRAIAQKVDGVYRWYWLGTREEANNVF